MAHNKSLNIKYVVVSDKPLDDVITPDAQTLFLSATEFISNEAPVDLRKLYKAKVINLCSNFDYLSKGYYCSLLAEARGMRCVPSAANAVTMNWKRHYQSSLPELNALLDKYFKEPPEEPLTRSYTIYFGRTEVESLEDLAGRLFDLFRFPLMTFQIGLDGKGKWVVKGVEPLSLPDLPAQKRDYFIETLKLFTGSAWRNKNDKKKKHWIAILHDPDEKQPPSDKNALGKFIKAGKDMNVSVELVTKNDFSSLLEFDAVLIRETTAINHHTYRFALKAENENIPCIDDTQSIIRCCNKVFQHELLTSKNIALPATWIVDRKTQKTLENELPYPVVVKIPDGSFSNGVIKAETPESFREAANELLKKSDIILVQEFVESDFDWRIGILNGEPLFACKYYMAQGHWQIYNHGAKTLKRRQGRHETLPVSRVPEHVLRVALRAAKLIGDGLYGVDLKEVNGRAIVMEVNDNPSLDSGVEDQVLGMKLYKAILQRLLDMIEQE
ncbi:MAG: RimK family protein [Alphaproteobacteria bacterium]|nr:RimK family protein [Alphaproteobacteria bacterium]